MYGISSENQRHPDAGSRSISFSFYIDMLSKSFVIVPAVNNDCVAARYEPGEAERSVGIRQHRKLAGIIALKFYHDSEIRAPSGREVNATADRVLSAGSGGIDAAALRLNRRNENHECRREANNSWQNVPKALGLFPEKMQHGKNSFFVLHRPAGAVLNR